jgi:hypothetical protein
LIKNAKDDEAKKEFAQENEPKAEAIKKKGERERKKGEGKIRQNVNNKAISVTPLIKAHTSSPL